jgi:hypothetical protein
MTTARSPLSQLKAQAGKIAAMLKAAERGERIDAQFAEKIFAARDKQNLIFVIAMDDKFLQIRIPWNLVRDASEGEIAEFILVRMRERNGTDVFV